MITRNVIHKWTLPMPDAELGWIQYEFLEGTRILAVQEQYDKPCIWTMSNAEEAKKVRRFFRAITTGKVFTGDLDKLAYIGTCQLMGGQYVVHVFEKVEE